MIKCKLKSKLHELDGDLFVSYMYILFIVLYEIKHQIYIVIILFSHLKYVLEKCSDLKLGPIKGIFKHNY